MNFLELASFSEEYVKVCARVCKKTSFRILLCTGCSITYIRKTRTVIALKEIVFYFGRTNLNFDILQ